MMPATSRDGMLASEEVSMERADWLQAGFDSAQARFLMLTAITHHRFGSRAWGEDAVRSLYAELAEIEAAALSASPARGKRR